jgi:hypothetical protein
MLSGLSTMFETVRYKCEQNVANIHWGHSTSHGVVIAGAAARAACIKAWERTVSIPAPHWFCTRHMLLNHPVNICVRHHVVNNVKHCPTTNMPHLPASHREHQGLKYVQLPKIHEDERHSDIFIKKENQNWNASNRCNKKCSLVNE